MKEAPSLESDSKVTQLDTTTFTANLTKSFCVGTVPHGGYVATIFLRVASAYLAPRNQPDPLAAHWQFLNATHAGPAVLIVEETKTGRAMSVVHITLYQEGLVSESPWISSKSKKKAVAYITNTLLEGERGVTLPTGFEMAAPPPPVNLEKLGRNQDPNWEALKMTIMDVVPMLDNFEFYTPKRSSSPMATYDLWLRMSNGEGFTTSALGYVADAAPALLIEAFRPTDLDKPVPKGGFAFDKIFWYPTVTMSLEVKKPLAGEEWLRIRAAAKVVNNGRYDAEIIVFDRDGDIVALSNHVALAVDGERNFGRSEKL
ncbi:thioesterase family [Fusarium albosuccineum]|uniref:Thioesterase family n=1 Tax=Fusarium albosuccineum TaxID=1237068 RepID=A0A8H4LR44_9HYPO|nr:thioesterase family [Fusarium albosuccineum]